ncbi:hypothetical protein EDD86DRAFT_109229 [Gorgonomyces haynaldii]|nr:hypothetical protein EDD86DRAFT_109229 [Gorgonomyces haynaldii]
MGTHFLGQYVPPRPLNAPRTWIMLCLLVITLLLLLGTFIYIVFQRNWTRLYKLQSAIPILTAFIGGCTHIAYSFSDTPPVVSYLTYWSQNMTALLFILVQLEILKHFHTVGFRLTKRFLTRFQIGWLFWYTVAWIPSYAVITTLGQEEPPFWLAWDNITFSPWVVSIILYGTFHTLYLSYILGTVEAALALREDQHCSKSRQNIKTKINITIWFIFVMDYAAMGVYLCTQFVDEFESRSNSFYQFSSDYNAIMYGCHVGLVVYIMELVKAFMQQAISSKDISITPSAQLQTSNTPT